MFSFETSTLICFAIHMQVLMLHNLRSVFVSLAREQLIRNHNINFFIMLKYNNFLHKYMEFI